MFWIPNAALNAVGGCLLPMSNGEMEILRSSFHLDWGGGGEIDAYLPLYKKGREFIFYPKKKKLF